MRKLAIVVLMALLCSTAWAAGGKRRAAELERIEAAGRVMNEIMAAPDKGIPTNILSDAECVAVVPSLLKGGFIVGGAYGKGVATCRTEKGWSAPAPFRIEGGSFGLQIGGEAVDLVMVIMNERGMRALLSSKFKVGVDASAAAGPVGRHAEGSTDWKMRAQVLTYSRARGAFAGISLNGAVIRQDKDDTRALYGHMVSFKSILTGVAPAPPGSEPFLSAVDKYAAQAKAAEQGQK
ncbi:MAG: lipid-binding SYLF domain-containing protein [Terriglobales bacterium]